MILSSDDQNALDVLGAALCEHEPRLAAKFGIFTRLTEGEGRPPDEDLVRSVRPVQPPRSARRVGSARPWPARPWSARPRGRPRWAQLGQSRWIILAPVALLLLLILTLTMSLAAGGRCVTATDPVHGLAVTGHRAVPACRPAGTAKTSSYGG
ncbi:MAG TPA: hypothetical protein VIJ82_00240 [Streptosporangiaceae bacterium]|jgi:hypothetical protein